MLCSGRIPKLTRMKSGSCSGSTDPTWNTTRFFLVSLSGHPNLTRPLFFPTRTREIHVIFKSCHRVMTLIATPEQGCHFVLPKLVISIASVLAIENQKFPLDGGGREVTISGGGPSFIGGFCLEKLDL